MKAGSDRDPARRRAGRPTGGDAATTRATILDAAVRCFAERGYEGTSTRDIAARAGLTHGTVYFYFPAKPDLYQEAYAHTMTLVLAEYQKAAEGKESLQAAMLSIIDTGARIIMERPESVTLVVRYRTDAVYAGQVQGTKGIRDLLARLTRQAVANGEIDIATGRQLTEAFAVMTWGMSVVGLGNPKALKTAVLGLKHLVRGGFATVAEPA
jgi:AcrR family transcriptional regulator